jgi:hypothetical protein
LVIIRAISLFNFLHLIFSSSFLFFIFSIVDFDRHFVFLHLHC